MVRRIAHVSDVHLLEPDARSSRGWYRIATRIVSVGRPIDPRARRRKLANALEHAKAGGANHIVVSGDLTEVGSDRELEEFAAVLSESNISPDEITLVPGNHDRYTTADAWARSLEGPLRPYAKSSAREPGKVVDRGGVTFLPVDSTLHQSIAWSRGEITKDTADALEKRLADPAFSRDALVLVVHHPPVEESKQGNAVWHWIDGLRGCARLFQLLVKHPNVQILHGHMHALADRLFGENRVFAAPATVEDPENAPRVRFYDVNGSLLKPVT